MFILYVILVLSFLALVWAAFSITRHIRRGPASIAEEPPVFAGPAATPAKAAKAGELAWKHFNKDAGDLQGAPRRRRRRVARRRVHRPIENGA